jgi:DNA-binding phage protein
MEIKTLPYDVAETLRTPDEIAPYLEACIEEADGDAAFIAQALSGDRSPSFDTVLKVISAFGLKLSAGVQEKAEVV